MAPSAEPTAACPPVAVTVPPRLLEDGEIVILAIKPSGWFVIIHSLPVLAAAAVAVGIACVARDALGTQAAQTAVLAICLAAACARLLAAGLQWMSRLYVLTNRRVIRVRGVLHQDVHQGLLSSVTRVTPGASVPERLVGVGSLYFEISGAGILDWSHVARVAEVRQVVLDALGRSN
jgi:hypothetical protein